MKVTKATFQIDSAGLPVALIEFSDGRRSQVDCFTKWLFVERGFIPTGFADIPERVIIYPNGEEVTFKGLVEDTEAAKALEPFGDYVEGTNLNLTRGQILYEVE